jgi:Kdo2-lipid IVA lauroyltransferase/acyltransferase
VSAAREAPPPGAPERPARRDVRHGEDWTLAQTLKNACLYLLVRAAVALADRLPSRVLLALTRWLGGLSHRVLRDERLLAEQNLARAFPGIDACALARSAFRNAGENLGRSLLLRRTAFSISAHVVVSDETRSLLERALSEGRGAVFVSAHIGPFEWLAARASELGLRPVVVVRESYDPRLDAIVDRHRLARGVAVIHRGHPDATIAIARALRNGMLVGFLSDLGSRVPSTAVRLLGLPASLPVGPQRFALRFAAPILVGALEPQADGHFELRAQRVFAQDLQELTQRVADALGVAIDRSREHWLWMARALGDAREVRSAPTSSSRPETLSLRNFD